MGYALSKLEVGCQLAMQNCCTCGTPFGIESGLEETLRKNHKSFYCPNGHGQSYTGKSESEILMEQLADSERRRTNELNTRLATERELARLKKRVGNGICPCCKRSFRNLGCHMKSKHPDFKEKQPTKI